MDESNSEADDGATVRPCEECGASVRDDNQSKHTRWHERLDEFQRDIYDDIYRGTGQ